MWLELFAVGVMLLHLYISPFTKVEESFNIQAVHDLINHGPDIHKYDHHDFPGVVPRSFVGPLVVAIISKPFVVLANNVGCGKFAQQLIVRAVLGLLTMFSLSKFCHGVERGFGPNVKKWLLVITTTQFHFLFYSSRPLPNIFALSLVLLALSAWLSHRHKLFIWLAGASIIIFRSELAMLFGVIMLSDLITQRVRVVTFISTTVVAGFVLLGMTVLVDSFFWQRWLWPEGELLWFNIVLNKSHEYGTLPFLWYFYSALPRALLSSLFLVPMGVYFNRSATCLLLPALTFTLLYSFLPHKELRFIIYTFPMLNTVAACALSYLWKGRKKSLLRKLLFLGALASLVLNVCATAGFLHISSHNYPGGEAMAALHRIEKVHKAHVHIDVFTAQSGVTRFTQLNPQWIYNKTEDLTPVGPDMMSFSHLLIGASSQAEAIKSVTLYKSTHKVIASIQAFDRVALDFNTFPPVSILYSTKCYVLKKIG